jgi:GntP family gluconate:H+ symporter
LPLPYAISAIGYIVSIPVFCDSAFVILSALNKTLAQKSKTPRIALTIALSTGLFAPHVLVPPTPGPLAAAAQLELQNLLLLIVFGGLVAFLLVVVGAIYAQYLAKKYKATTSFEFHKVAHIDQEPFSPDNLPNIYQSLSPIVVPILLMAAGSTVQFISPKLGAFNNIIALIGSPEAALFIGLLLAMRLNNEKRIKGDQSKKNLLEGGLKLAAPILLITAMGGALGGIIKELPLTQYLSAYTEIQQFGLVLPFGIAALLKTAQGSSTVAIITTSSIIFPILGQLGMITELDKVWVIIAIGTGSMTVSHANDSYFWIVSQMGGIDVKTAFRHHTLATLIQGITGLILVLILYSLSNL